MHDSAPSKAKTPRVRFAPSPTGYLHVGGVRTALFNWLFAHGTDEHAYRCFCTEDELDQQTLRQAAASLGLRAGPIIQAVRVTVCGRKSAPPLFETLAVLGREFCLASISQAEESLQPLA